MRYNDAIRLVVLLTYASLFSSALLININSSHSDSVHSALKIIKFCTRCPSPEREGSIVLGMIARHGPRHFHLTSDIVYSIPNFGESRKIMNRHELRDSIALVDRGKVSLVEKVKNIQKTGTLAIIVVDDGQCSEAFQHCGRRVGSPSEGGFGAYDSAMLWRDVTVPVLLVTLSTGEKIRAMMKNKRIEVPLLGWQNVTQYQCPNGDEEFL